MTRLPPLLIALPGNTVLAAQLRACLPSDSGSVEIHHFPDGESCPRFVTPVAGRDVVFVCALDAPDGKILPLYLAAGVARELGARSIGLVVPYLPYMRQDARFREGEGITSAHFARLLSSCCDWLVTVDPHLHRHPTLAAIYSCATQVVHAAPAISSWIAANVARPIIVGPDAESEQWVAQVAAAAGCPFTVLAKIRSGDHAVAVSMPDTAGWQDRTPVLVDDIISTARTMVAAARQITATGMAAPVCIGVHALFAGDALAALQAAGVQAIVTCNTVAHATNTIDLSSAISTAVTGLLQDFQAN